MVVSANYWFLDVRTLADLGLYGGSALASVWSPDNSWSLSTFDENNAFTRVLTPEWMYAWNAVPPLRAWRVWELLEEALRLRISPLDWVYPCYMRLCMGSSIAALILMAINLAAMGRALVATTKLVHWSQYPLGSANRWRAWYNSMQSKVSFMFGTLRFSNKFPDVP